MVQLIFKRIPRGSYNKKNHNIFISRYPALSDVKPERSGIGCRGCDNVHPLYSFSRHIKRWGISCNRDLICDECTHSSTYFKRLVNSMNSRARRRNHPVPEFNYQDLHALYRIQRGKCAISGLPLETSGVYNPFNISPERISNDLPYSRHNVCLIMQMFQTGFADMSPGEFRELLLYDRTVDAFHFDPSILEHVRRKKTAPVVDPTDDGTRTCCSCHVALDNACFRKGRGKCKRCEADDTKQHANTPAGFLTKLISTCGQSALRRGKRKSRDDKSHIIARDLRQLIIERLVEQGGRCAITDRPFVFTVGHNHRPSVDRIDDTQGYVRGNIVMILAPLNVPCKPNVEDYRSLIDRMKAET